MNNDVASLPKSMAERALWARSEYINNPTNSQIDDELLVWCFNSEDNLWYSIMGNYSSIAPLEKSKRKAVYQNIQDEKNKKYQDEYEQKYQEVIYYSKVREKVLERDNRTCQICNAFAPTKLHIHHILKRKEGGTDHFDNLITVCPSCHSLADRKGYNPTWKK